VRLYVRIRPTSSILPAAVTARPPRDSPDDLSASLSGSPEAGSPSYGGLGGVTGETPPGQVA